MTNMTREQIEQKYDEFFGTGYWETEYKKHIVEFVFQCSNNGKPLVSGSLPQFDVAGFKRWMSGWVEPKHINTIAQYVVKELSGNDR